ncbi:fructose-1,6-bisphosphatase II / sedoheptulose-1,7-bisphosphatase [Candidatus Pelagibacter ubique]|uniref:Fructose-1,6-bisphosphatase n=1 Tax=Pelagibacter ubique TaxID=198252 RepID=A0ABX1T3I4_PELUQ|nr:class II fructose-bisphosphatase [Candidatus Pelagibacter ubique]NMN68004.1 fructose-1,6-bisphosphatase II / sedoheptulose-1,7-bisphosphatase [Candidatus Pelagibacter ubique]
MSIDKKYIDQFINVSSKAALASSYLVGKKNKIAADQAAVDSMRFELNKMDISGEVVIGEGSLDEAPMLYTGELLGSKNGPSFDIAVDPLEGTNFAANNLPGAISVIAIAEKGNLFNAPETYMDKISTGKVEKGLIDLDNPLKKNIYNLADFMNKDISSITACILDRPRHKKIIDELKRLNVKIKLITDGDVLGALYVSNPKYNVDIFLGIGGGPEGVLAACALDTFDCHFQGRFIFDNDKDKHEAQKMGITDFNKKYELNEIIKGDSIFCATGITTNDVLTGIKIRDNNYISETLVTHKNTHLKKIIKKSTIIKG